MSERGLLPVNCVWILCEYILIIWIFFYSWKMSYSEYLLFLFTSLCFVCNSLECVVYLLNPCIFTEFHFIYLFFFCILLVLFWWHHKPSRSPTFSLALSMLFHAVSMLINYMLIYGNTSCLFSRLTCAF